MTIRLTEEEKIQVLNSDDVYSIMQKVLLREKKIDRDKEHFWIVCLANNNRILLVELISLGSVNKTIVEPMEVFSFALQKRAVRIILVHNHPSGDIEPSKADIQLTDKMQAIGRFINMPVIDHLVISETNYYSFATTGLLSKIERESTFDLTFEKAEKLKDQLKAVEKMKAIEIAKALIERGVDKDVVQQSTGLTLKQVEQLMKEAGK